MLICLLILTKNNVHITAQGKEALAYQGSLGTEQLVLLDSLKGYISLSISGRLTPDDMPRVSS